MTSETNEIETLTLENDSYLEFITVTLVLVQDPEDEDLYGATAIFNLEVDEDGKPTKTLCLDVAVTGTKEEVLGNGINALAFLLGGDKVSAIVPVYTPDGEELEVIDLTELPEPGAKKKQKARVTHG